MKIEETPVQWQNHPNSQDRILENSFGMLTDLITLRFRVLFGQYD